MIKKSIGILLTICIIFNCYTYPTFAISKQELQQRKEEYKNQLAQINLILDEMYTKRDKLLENMNQINSEIVDLNVEIQQAKKDIEETKSNIKIKEKNIAQRKSELRLAVAEKNKQYQMMKKRIQFIYEHNSGDKIFIELLSSNNLEQILNKKEYIEKLEQADKELFKKYIDTIDKIRFIKENLEKERKELIEKKDLLEKQKVGLEETEEELEYQLIQLKNENLINEDNIYNIEKDAAALADNIAEINYNIELKEEEQRRIAQEQAYYEQLREEQEENISEETQEEEQSNIDYEEEQSNIDYEEPYEEEELAEYYEEQQVTEYEEYDFDDQPAADIVAYARQFLGNPYVWGGNSLTNGCDCSHFVWNVLKDTGHYNGDYYTSGGWAGLGSSVNSLDQAQAGDVIVYSGHVAIYDGQGGIVQAKGSKYGITNDRSADCKSIVAIRRFD